MTVTTVTVVNQGLAVDIGQKPLFKKRQYWAKKSLIQLIGYITRQFNFKIN